MNCKPDQLCRVVGGANHGVIVRTIALEASAAFEMRGPTWSVELLQSAMGFTRITVNGLGFNGPDRRLPAGSVVLIPDRGLRPLHDGDEQDETLAANWKRTPAVDSRVFAAPKRQVEFTQ